MGSCGECNEFVKVKKEYLNRGDVGRERDLGQSGLGRVFKAAKT